MPEQSRDRKDNRFSPALIVAIIAYFIFKHFGPPLYGAFVNIPSAAAALFLAAAIAAVTSDCFWYLGNVFERRSVNTASGNKGTGGFATLDDIAHELANGWAPYWGAFAGVPLLVDFASSALVLGPSGVGKGIKNLLISILCNWHSKTIYDFKGEICAMLARVLRERGEIVRILNIGDVLSDLIGPSDHYNPLCVLQDSFMRKGGLRDIADDLREFGLQLVQEPGGNDEVSENTYWREGSRLFVIFAILITLLVGGSTATLGDVAKLLSSKKNLLRNAKWACGQLRKATTNGDIEYLSMPIWESPWVHLHDPQDVESFIAYLEDLATTIVEQLESDDTKSSGPFLTGARQSVAIYNTTTRAHEVTSKTTMRFKEQKESEKVVTTFIIVDASRIEAQKPVISLIQWCMLLEYKRCINPHRPVYVYADEATNFFLHSLGSLLTWGRGFGIRFIFYIQSLAAFQNVYGPEVLSTLMSETEVKLYLPGQKDPDTLELIEQALGQESYISLGHSGSTDTKDYWIGGTNFSEDGKPVQEGDQIRRSGKGILFIRSNKAVAVDLPTIAEVAPFRDQIDINPYHGKPFLRRVTLRIDPTRMHRGWLKKLSSLFKRKPKREYAEKKQHLWRMAQLCRTMSNLINLWHIGAITLFFISPIGPHLAISYDGPWCTYLGSRGFVEILNGPDCPLLIILNKADLQ